MPNKKSFAIYCSGSASRVTKFYSNIKNLNLLSPKKIVYDGNQDKVKDDLFNLFGEKLEFFNVDILSKELKKKIHTATSNFIYKTLNENNIDYLICFGTKIIKNPLITDYKGRLINFHPSILPSYKGLNAIDQAIKDNAIFLGNTAHLIDEEVDSGKILIQTSMLSDDFKDYEDVLELQFPMIKMILRDMLNYEISDGELFSDLNKRDASFSIPKNVRF